MRRGLIAVLGAVALLTTAGAAFAQRTTGNIVGKVTDDSGAVLPGVTVTLKGETIVGTQTSVTNESGLYRFAALPPGTYSLTFTLSGFSTLKRAGLKVSVGGTLEENAALKVGGHERRAHGGGRVAGGRHDHQPGVHELRQGLGEERPPAALHLLRPHQRRPRGEPDHLHQLPLHAPSAPPPTRTPTSSTAPTSRRPPPARPGPGPTPTPSRRSRSCPWARPRSTAACRARSSTW